MNLYEPISAMNEYILPNEEKICGTIPTILLKIATSRDKDWDIWGVARCYFTLYYKHELLFLL